MQHVFTYGPVPIDVADRVTFQESEIGNVSEQWQVRVLGDVLTTTQYGLSVRADREGDYPTLRMSNLIDGRVDPSDLKYVDLSLSDFHKFRLNKGDVLFNRTNSFELVGKTAIFDLDNVFVFASYLIRLVSNTDHLLPEYLNYYLNWDATQSRLKTLASRGVSQSNISASKLRNLPAAIPPLEEQRTIVGMLEAVDRKVHAEEARKASLGALFDSLLHHLMTGKIRVHDVPEVGDAAG